MLYIGPGYEMNPPKNPTRCEFHETFGSVPIRCAEQFDPNSRTARYCAYHKQLLRLRAYKVTRLRKNGSIPGVRKVKSRTLSKIGISGYVTFDCGHVRHYQDRNDLPRVGEKARCLKCYAGKAVR